MKAKHTPGPWKVETVPIESRGGSNTCHKIGPFNACIYDDSRPRENGISEEENLANATVMAAAPELLEFALLFSSQLANGKIDTLKARKGEEKEVANMVRMNIKAIQKATE